jgi:hypothetical protein
MPDTSTVDVRGVQAPSKHTSLAAHAWPHAPQLAGSRLSMTHAPKQDCVPAGHASKHWPPLHVAAPPEGPGHPCPQEPQWDGSWAVSTHSEPHSVKPGAHDVPHEPPEHVATKSPLAGQGFAQDPQNCGSLVRSTQMVLQFVSGGLHADAHPVGVHTWPAPHAAPHEPQLVIDRRFASHPLEARPSQSA